MALQLRKSVFNLIKSLNRHVASDHYNSQTGLSFHNTNLYCKVNSFNDRKNLGLGISPLLILGQKGHVLAVSTKIQYMFYNRF